MPRRTCIQIGCLTFKSKKEAKDYIRPIFNKYKDGQRIAGEEDSFLRDLISLHPESVTKIGSGISHFTIQPDQEWGTTRHFVLVRLDGQSTDFSFHTCIDGSNKRQDVYSALRHAVSEQVIAFKRSAFAGDILPLCSYHNCSLTELEAHVDHVSPNTFLILANNWMAINSLSIEDVELVDNADNQWIRELRDKEQARSWQEYHIKNATLRIISKLANLSDSKKAA